MGVKNKIKEIADAASKRGYDASIRDIAYALMRVHFDDKLIAYTVIKGMSPENEEEIENFDKDEKIQFLIRYFKNESNPKKDKKQEAKAIIAASQIPREAEQNEFISFEDNFAGAVAGLARIQELRDACDKRDIKTLASLEKSELEIRVKIVDKFDGQKKEQKTWVVTPKVYDYICPWTRHECYQIKKEDAMAKWHLIEDPDYKE